MSKKKKSHDTHASATRSSISRAPHPISSLGISTITIKMSIAQIAAYQDSRQFGNIRYKIKTSICALPSRTLSFLYKPNQ